MLYKNIASRCILIIMLFSLSQAGTLKGNVTTQGGIAIPNVLVNLVSKTVAGYDAKDTTDVNGTFEFTGFQEGVYRISFTKAGRISNDTLLVLIDEKNSFSTSLMSSAIPGTVHSGVVSGTWLPENNPHFIVDTVIVLDSLYIAPGCTITANNSKPIKFNGLLRIGDKNSNKRVKLNYVNLIPTDSTCKIHLSNVDVDQGYWYINYAEYVSIYNCILSQDYLYIRALKTIIDFTKIVTKIKIGGNGRNTSITSPNGGSVSYGFYLYADDTLVINNSKTENGIQSFLDGNVILCERSCFNEMNLFAWNCKNVNFNFCIMNGSKLAIYADSSFSIDHCNISFYDLTNSIRAITNSKGIITNCIIKSFGITAMAIVTKDTLYTSPFQNDLFLSISQHSGSPPAPNKVFIAGLGTPVKKNRNGLDCDLWYNICADPQVVDTLTGELSSTSPALFAANDSTHIGAWQGIPNAIAGDELKTKTTYNKKLQIQVCGSTVRIEIPDRYNDVKLSIYDLKGRLIHSELNIHSPVYKWNSDSRQEGCYLATIQNNEKGNQINAGVMTNRFYIIGK